ncbi:MAG: 50S ribosomal protein L18 [Pseudomonadota bacterium]|nr:50S ribosomal protein L18 [Pseudomonadota bacterium]
MNKKQGRMRRAKKTRAKIRELCVPRLSVHRTSKHIYAQIISDDSSTVLTAASTTQDVLRQSLKKTGNIEAAQAVGKSIAENAKLIGIDRVAFDRSGFRYHGRVKALADSARENGLKL